jgi:hypothetical protein
LAPGPSRFRASVVNAQIFDFRDKKIGNFPNVTNSAVSSIDQQRQIEKPAGPLRKASPSRPAWRKKVNIMEHLVIFVNGKKKTSTDDGVTNPMTVDAIARLAGLTGDTAVVRERKGEDGPVGEPLSGSVPIKNGEHFVVTRRNVEGGCR